ncbi:MULTISPECIES: hypothetical protein [unclassified Bartonella]|nr:MULTISPECIES: hypothetical protein [unclassified Bartonella]
MKPFILCKKQTPLFPIFITAISNPRFKSTFTAKQAAFISIG